MISITFQPKEQTKINVQPPMLSAKHQGDKYLYAIDLKHKIFRDMSKTSTRLRIQDCPELASILNKNKNTINLIEKNDVQVHNGENSIEINDMELQADKLAVENLIKFIAGSEEHQLKNLKALYEEALIKIISKRNSLLILEAALAYNAEELKKEAIEFIIANIKHIWKTADEFKLFTQKNHDVAYEIMRKFIDKIKSESKGNNTK